MRTLAAITAVALLAAGCGRDTLWARWRAERDLWHADRAARGIASDPHAAPAEREQAAARYRHVAERWPAAVWVPRAAADSLAADVARIGGRAAIRAAALAWAAGERDRSGAAFAAVEHAYAGVWPVALEAGLARAEAAARAGDSAAACLARETVARGPVVGPDGMPVDGVLESAPAVALAHRRAGHAAQADSAWRAFAGALESALRAHSAGPAAPRLWLALAVARGELGVAGRAGARAALAHVLSDRGASGLAGDALLGLARLSLDDGDGGGAIVLARRARAALAPEHALEAVDVEAACWERGGRPDSAIAVYGRAVDERWAPDYLLTRARAERARLFERGGRWEEARGELHAVIASDPLSGYAFQAMRRLVAHHLERREPELAELEAAWCVGRLDRTLATVLDPGVLLAARRTRADLLLAIGADRRAFAALENLWQRHSREPDGAWAGLKAAELAEHRLDDRAAALRLYRQVAATAPDPGARREAQAGARRLAGGG